MLHLNNRQGLYLLRFESKVRRGSISNYLSPLIKLSCSSSVPNNPRSS
jgi:hypothetical protein